MDKIFCDDCVYTDIADWVQIEGTEKVEPEYWCEKYNKYCLDVIECEYKVESEEINSDENFQEFKKSVMHPLTQSILKTRK